MRVDYSSNYVSPGYFDAMGIRLLRGRDFTAADRFGGPMVIVVNEEFARRYVPDTHAIGRHLYLPTGRDTETFAEIVGVVANSKYRTIGEEVEPAIYESYVQRRGSERRVRIIAAATAAGAIDAGALRAAILEVDGTAAVDVLPMASALAVAFVPSRVGAFVMGALGVLGALLATVGLYGVVAFNVGRRTGEVAVRMALGASRASGASPRARRHRLARRRSALSPAWSCRSLRRRSCRRSSSQNSPPTIPSASPRPRRS